MIFNLQLNLMEWSNTSYVTKGQKGMSLVMEKACQEARNGNMDLKESV